MPLVTVGRIAVEVPECCVPDLVGHDRPELIAREHADRVWRDEYVAGPVVVPHEHGLDRRTVAEERADVDAPPSDRQDGDHLLHVDVGGGLHA